MSFSIQDLAGTALPTPSQATQPTSTQPAQPTQPTPTEQPSSASGVFTMNDFATPADTTPTKTATDAAARSEAYKQKAWHDAYHGVLEGRFGDAAHSLASLFANPDESVNPVQNAIGVAKGAGQTVNFGGEMVNKVLPKSLQIPAIPNTKPTNPSQEFGADLETMAEFMLGDEAIKGLEGLSRTEKLAKLLPTMKLLENSPKLMKLTQAAYRVAKMSGLTAGVSAAHPGEGETRGHAAVRGAATGAVLGGAGEVLNAGGEALANMRKANGEAPIESAVNKTVAKSGLPEGSPETTAPIGEDIQPTLQKGIHDIAKSAGQDAGIDAEAPKSVRDAFKTQADAVLEKSKAAYKELDSASGGQWQRFDNALKNINRQIQEKVGIDDDAVELLEQKRNEIETSQAQLVEDLKADGKVKPELADKAKADYKKAMALSDVDNAVKASTKGRAGVGQGIETVDPNKLAPRLQKLYDSGRLKQAVGEDAASEFIGHAENAQTATQSIKDFVPSSATGQKALADLIRPNTGTGVTGRMTGIPQLRQLLGFEPSTNWLGVYRDMSGLGADEMTTRFGADAPLARTYVQRQALYQIGRILAKGYALKKISENVGIPTAILHTLVGAE
jgi:hypothetical protein